MADNSLKDAIDLISIGAGRDGYRVGNGAMWAGSNTSIADATFVDWGLARATDRDAPPAPLAR